MEEIIHVPKAGATRLEGDLTPDRPSTGHHGSTGHVWLGCWPQDSSGTNPVTHTGQFRQLDPISTRFHSASISGSDFHFFGSRPSPHPPPMATPRAAQSWRMRSELAEVVTQERLRQRPVEQFVDIPVPMPQEAGTGLGGGRGRTQRAQSLRGLEEEREGALGGEDGAH